MNERVPQHPFEVIISIGGDTWDYVERTMSELAEHLKERGPECGLISGGSGGSHSVSIARREVSVEQFHKELEEWRVSQIAAKESAQ